MSMVAMLVAPTFAAAIERPRSFATAFGPEGIEVALVDLREVAARGGWPALTAATASEPPLELGVRSPAVVSLRQTLAARGDLATAESLDPQLFDEAVANAVRSFQERHGLRPDCAVGPKTRQALAVSVSARIAQLERTLAARRAMPPSLGERFVLVNLAGYELEAFTSSVAGERALLTRVQAGQKGWRTPLFATRVTGVVVNPKWTVPPRIARTEMVPRFARDPAALKRLGFRVYRADGSEVDPRGIDWGALVGKPNEYRFVQQPGPRNSLGRVRLKLENYGGVTFHDTPAVELFARDERDVTHGCVRVENPFLFVDGLLHDQPLDAKRRLAQARETSETTEIRLATPLPIFVVDWSAWVDIDGRLQFRAKEYSR